MTQFRFFTQVFPIDRVQNRILIISLDIARHSFYCIF